eukprot:65104-Amphidinium_carterae.1
MFRVYLPGLVMTNGVLLIQSSIVPPEGFPGWVRGVRSHDNLTNDEIYATLCSHGDVSLDTLAFLSCLDSWGLSVDAFNNIDPAWYPDHEEAEPPAGHREIQSTPPL